MYPANCQICFAVYGVDKFRILLCGHGFCATCISRIPAIERSNNTKIHCPLCRDKVHKSHISRGIYLDFVDPKAVVVDGVVEGMNKMNEDTPLASVRKAADKLDRGAKSCDGNVDLTTQLLQSIDDFKARIIPLFEKVRQQEQQLSDARAESRAHLSQKLALERRLAKSDAIYRENESLKVEVEKAREIVEETTVAAEEMKEKMLALQNELASYKKIASDLDTDKKRMVDQLERNVNAARVAKEKYKTVKQQNAELQKQLERQREEPLSPISQPPQPQDYDGDFSSHEMTRHSFGIRATQRHDENEFDWEGMPRPGFGSDWQLNRPKKENYGVLKKSRPAGTSPSQRRVTNPTALVTLRLNRKGQPTTAVQLGPKRTLKAAF